MLRPSRTVETKPKRAPVQQIEAVHEGRSWISWAVAASVAVTVAGLIAWQTYVPRYRMLGQPLSSDAPVMVMLQGADQMQADFDAEGDHLASTTPEATWLMVNAPHASRYERRWVQGPKWDDVERTKAESFVEIDRVIEQLREAGVADSDIYLGGYDEGGQLALDYAANREGFSPAGLVLLSAGLPPWVLKDMSALADTRAFITHGLRDKEAKVLASERLYEQLYEVGARAEFSTYAGDRSLDAETADKLGEFIGEH